MKKTKLKVGIIKDSASGQAVTEYVIVLAVTLILVLALVFLLRTMGEYGERTVDCIGYAVP